MALEELLKWAAGIIISIIAAGLTFKFIISTKKVDKSQIIKVTQNHNHASGDIVGGNKTTNKK